MNWKLLVVFLCLTLLPCLQANPAPEAAQGNPFSDSYRDALVAFHAGKWDEAHKAAEAAVKKDPKNSRIKLLLGRIDLEQKNYSLAESEVKEAIAAAPEFPPAYEALGDIYLRRKNFVQARDSYDQFLKLKPKDADGILKLIYCEIGRGDFVTAGQDLQQLDPADQVRPCYYFARAALARSFNRPAEASKTLEMARTMYGNTVWADYMKTYMDQFPPGENASSS